MIRGILSGTRQSGSNYFYSYMAMVGAVSCIFLPAKFLLLFETSIEFYFDRIAILLFSIFLAWAGFAKPFKKSTFHVLMRVFFYIYTIDASVLAFLNNYHLVYLVTLLFTIQLCALSFRTVKQSDIYLYVIITFTEILVLYNKDIATNIKLEITSLLFFSFIIQFIIARSKQRILSHLRAHRDILQAISNKSEHALVVSDTTGKIIDLNASGAKLFGYSVEEVIGQDFAIFRKYELTPKEIEEALEIIRLNNSWSVETMLVRKDGTEFHAYVSIASIKREDLDLLVYRVRDMNDDIIQKSELIKAKDAAEAAAMAKSQFVATMSHEIRTPLNGVIGMASLLQSTPLNPRQQEYASTIQKSGQSLMVLINDILDFSKMESGKMILDEQPTDFREAVLEVVDLLRPHAESKGLVVSVDISPELPEVLYLDSSRAKQVLLNLMGNAIKFTERGFVRCKVTARTTEENKTRIFVSIEDTGVGIPENKMHLLFDSFSQADATTSRKYGGTGLGLTISKEIVELMNGTIKAESAEGVGSKFMFSILADTSNEKIEKNESTEDLLKPELFEGVKILIAEDNFVNQRVLQYMLETLGLHSEVVANGVEVVEFAEKERVDIVLMDVQMPEMDGIEATRVLREKFGDQIHIIAMTANSGKGDKDKCLAAGMNDFISKPFVIEQVSQALMLWKESS